MIINSDPVPHIVDDYEPCKTCGIKERAKGRRMCSSCYYTNYYHRMPHMEERRKEQSRRTANKKRASMSWEERAKLRTGLYREERRNLSVDFLKHLREQTVNCSCCNTELDYNFHAGCKLPYNYATIDKVVPALGYEESNVAIICKQCNRRKDNLTLDEAKMIVDYIERMIGGCK